MAGGPSASGARTPGRSAASASGKVSAKRALTKSRIAGDAPEVARERQPAGLGEPLAVAREQLGPGAAEPVDRLLEVADQEQLAAGQVDAGERLEDLGLDRVGVLELVDEDQVDRPGQRVADAVRGVVEEVAGQEQEVVVVDPASRPLGPVVGLADVPGQAGEHQAVPGRLERHLVVTLEGLDQLLRAFADRFEVLLHGFISFGRRPELRTRPPGPWPLVAGRPEERDRVVGRLELRGPFAEPGEPGAGLGVVEGRRGDEVEAGPQAVEEGPDQGGPDLELPDLGPPLDQFPGLPAGPVAEVAGPSGCRGSRRAPGGPSRCRTRRPARSGRGRRATRRSRRARSSASSRIARAMVSSKTAKPGSTPALDGVAAEDVAAGRVERADPRRLEPPEDHPPAGLGRRPSTIRARHSLRIRSRSSRAAWLVNVRATTRPRGLAPGPSRARTNRSARTNVLPHPAPALRATLAPETARARACSSVGGLRSVMRRPPGSTPASAGPTRPCRRTGPP